MVLFGEVLKTKFTIEEIIFSNSHMIHLRNTYNLKYRNEEILYLISNVIFVNSKLDVEVDSIFLLTI